MLDNVKEFLIKELEFNIKMQEKYLNDYNNGRKGTLFIESETYVYNVFRERKKVRKIYLGKIKDIPIEIIQLEIDSNKQNKELYLELKHEEKKLRKAIGCL